MAQSNAKTVIRKGLGPVFQFTRDGVQNAFSKLGTAFDKHRHTKPGAQGSVMSQIEIDGLYYHSMIARRIVDRPARDALKRGFEVRFDDPELTDWVESELKRLKARHVLKKALIYARKDGGSGVVVMTDGETDVSEPMKSGARIFALRPHSRWKLTVGQIENDYARLNWNQPTEYNLPGNKPQPLHHTRVLRMTGLDVDDDKQADYHTWGQSVVESIWPAYKDLATCSNSLATQMHDAIYNILKLEGLPSLLMHGDGQSVLDARIEAVALGRSILSAIVIGTNEEYVTREIDLTKQIAAFDVFSQILSADSNMPLTFLFGQAPKGFSAADLNAIEAYYEYCETLQSDDLDPAIERLVKLILNQKQITAEFSIVWPPMEKPDELTASQVRMTTIQADATLYSLGAMTSGEIRARHYGDEFAPDMSLEELPEEAIEVPEPPPGSPEYPTVDQMVADALAAQRPEARKTMICAYPPEGWLNRFNELFPGAEPFTHLTLKYCGALTPGETLGLIAELQIATGQAIMKSAGSAKVVIKGHAGFFNAGKYCEVLLAEPTPELQTVQATAAYAAQGLSGISDHAFLPHVTVRYHDVPFVAQPVEKSDFPEWTIRSICVVQQDEVIEEIFVC